MAQNGSKRIRWAGTGSFGTVALAALILSLLSVRAPGREPASAGERRQAAAARQAQPPASAFPLAAGTYWIYQALVSWGPEGTTVPQEKLFPWKMEVLRTIPRNGLLAAVVKGFPRDLDRSEGDTAPAESLLVETGGTKFYWIPPASFQAALARLEDRGDSLDGLVGDDQIFLDLPLVRGKKFCNMTGMIRTDEFYCWVAGEPAPADLAGAKGLPAGAHTAFPVQFLTADDSTSFDFVPGIGITSYSYQVHGTAFDTELHLIEFHSGTP